MLGHSPRQTLSQILIVVLLLIQLAPDPDLSLILTWLQFLSMMMSMHQEAGRKKGHQYQVLYLILSMH